jgi:Ca2+/H+ antiporter
LEIGSAYAIQVALVQIPVLVGFSAIWTHFGPDAIPKNFQPGKHVSNLVQTTNSLLRWSATSDNVDFVKKSQFTLVFPRWEFYTILFSVFLRMID